MEEMLIQMGLLVEPQAGEPLIQAEMKMNGSGKVTMGDLKVIKD